MKRFALLIILFSVSIYSQDIWHKLSGPEGGFTGALFMKGDTILYSSLLPSNIFFSTDRGDSWNKTNLKLQKRVVDFVDAPDGTFLLTASENGVYRSSDLINWQKISGTIKVEHFGRDYSNNIFASLLGDPAYGSVSGIYSSSDAGLSWDLDYNSLYTVNDILLRADSSMIIAANEKILIEKNNSWTTITMPGMADIKLAINQDSLIFASSETFKYSTNNGNYWTEGDENHFLYPERMYDLIFNTRLIGAFADLTNFGGNGWGAAISDDSGKTWSWSNNGLPLYTVGGNLAKSGNDTYLGTWGSGVFKSTDFGDSWSPINNGINASEVMDIQLGKDSTVFAAAWASGLSKSTDYGKSWKMINNGVSNDYFYGIVSDSAGNLYAGSERGLFKSTDNGDNWTITSYTGFCNKVYKDSYNRIYIVNNGEGLYRSSDHGSTFQKVDKGFVNEGVWSFAQDSSGNLLTGTSDGWIYKSTNDGNSWFTFRVSVTSSYGMNNIAVAPNGSVFAGSYDEGVLRTTDNGLTWKQLKTGSSWKYVSSLAVNKSGQIFVSLKQNTYLDAEEILLVSSDNGETFKNCTGNLQLVYLHNIKFDDKGKIWIASRDGIYVADLENITNVESQNSIVEKYQLYQNYPNPFNPTTEIKYSLPSANYVSIKVFDLLGKEITSLVNEDKPAGEYSVTFNGSRFPSGVYFYTIRAGNFVETKKLMILK